MSDTGTRLLPANITLLQPGSRGYRLSDALTVASMTQQVANATTGTQIAQLQTDVTTLQGQVGTLQGQVGTLQGQVSTLQGQVSTLQGQVTALTAFQASFTYQQIEVSTGSYYLDTRLIYRRSFVPPSSVVGTANTVATYAHGVPNINYIVAIQAVVGQSQGTNLPLTFVQTAQQPMVNGLSIWADTVNLYFSVGNTIFTSYVVVVTMWYTTTNR